MVNFIVSGCPRSGTSLLMQILYNAGMDIATDGKRVADESNKKGYFEIDSIINKLKENPDLIFDYEGKVVKIIHYGLKFLPKGDYKLIYIERNLDEVMISMEKMIGKKDSNIDKTKKAFFEINEKTKKFIQEREDISVLFVKYNELINNSFKVIDLIIDFFDIDKSKKEEMIKAIDVNQYRNRV